MTTGAEGRRTDLPQDGGFDWDAAFTRLLEHDGPPPAFGQELARLRADHHWSKRDLAEQLRQAMRAKKIRQVPDMDSLMRMVRNWEKGRHWPSEFYRGVLADLYRMPELRLRARPEVTE
jgi:hypothetical protein